MLAACMASRPSSQRLGSDPCTARIEPVAPKVFIEPSPSFVSIKIATQPDQLIFNKGIHWEEDQCTHRCRPVPDRISLRLSADPLCPPTSTFHVGRTIWPSDRFSSETA